MVNKVHQSSTSVPVETAWDKTKGFLGRHKVAILATVAVASVAAAAYVVMQSLSQDDKKAFYEKGAQNNWASKWLFQKWSSGDTCQADGERTQIGNELLKKWDAQTDDLYNSQGRKNFSSWIDEQRKAGVCPEPKEVLSMAFKMRAKLLPDDIYKTSCLDEALSAGKVRDVYHTWVSALESNTQARFEKGGPALSLSPETLQSFLLQESLLESEARNTIRLGTIKLLGDSELRDMNLKVGLNRKDCLTPAYLVGKYCSKLSPYECALKISEKAQTSNWQVDLGNWAASWLDRIPLDFFELLGGMSMNQPSFRA